MRPFMANPFWPQPAAKGSYLTSRTGRGYVSPPAGRGHPSLNRLTRYTAGSDDASIRSYAPNNLNCISQLPAELLLTILKFALSRGALSYYGQLLRLLFVCKDWNKLFMSSGGVWGQISDTARNNGTDGWTTPLHRSGCALLDVTATEGFWDEVDPAKRAMYWRTVTGLIGRWHSATICGIEGADGDHFTPTRPPTDLSTLEKKEAPYLRHCALSVQNRSSTFRPGASKSVNLFRGAMPCLEHFAIENATLRNWQSINTGRLRLLEISQIRQPGLATHTLLEILHHNQALEHLLLKETDFTTLPGSRIESFNLPKLRAIHVFRIPSPTVSQLMLSVNAPACSDCNVQLEWKNQQPLDLYDAFDHFFASMAEPRVPLATLAVIAMRASWFELEMYTQRPRVTLFRISSRGLPPGRLLTDWLVPLLLRLEGDNVDVRLKLGSDVGLAADEFAEVLWRLPQLTRLSVNGTEQDTEDLVRRMGVPLHAANRHAWLMPKLWSFTVEGKCPTDQMELLRMVRARQQVARWSNHWGRGAGSQERVVPISQIGFGWNSGVEDEVRRALHDLTCPPKNCSRRRS